MASLGGKPEADTGFLRHKREAHAHPHGDRPPTHPRRHTCLTRTCTHAMDAPAPPCVPGLAHGPLGAPAGGARLAAWAT